MPANASVIIGRARLVLCRGDITRESTDAIVNAANPSLMGGGGVDGAIHRVGGEAILRECRVIRESLGTTLPRGEAVITSGGKLPARFVIHTAGPVWEGGVGGEGEVLARCYRSSLTLADDRALASVAFPSISTGVYGYPVGLAAEVALGTVRAFLETAKSLTLVRFVLFDGPTFDAYRDALAD